jgi:hypothetical protein
MADLICGKKLLVAGFIAAGTIGPAHLRASPFFDLLDPGKPSVEAA